MDKSEYVWWVFFLFTSATSVFCFISLYESMKKVRDFQHGRLRELANSFGWFVFLAFSFTIWRTLVNLSSFDFYWILRLAGWI